MSTSKLIVPLDTHMHRICPALRLTQRKQADMRTAAEITAAFRTIAPEDPVKYDFALTRLGIRDDTDMNLEIEQLSNKEFDGLVKSRHTPYFVIPAKAGIQ